MLFRSLHWTHPHPHHRYLPLKNLNEDDYYDYDVAFPHHLRHEILATQISHYDMDLDCSRREVSLRLQISHSFGY